MSDLARPAELRLLPLFATVLVIAFCVCLFDLADARRFLGDIDDQIREVQIHHLMFGGGSWWDLGLPAVALPEPYVSPWSRLIDAPYVLIASLLTPVFGPETALGLAFDIWPPVMLAVFSLQCAVIYRRMSVAASLLGYVVVASATILMAFALWEFVPGRIDHHNAQIVALMAILCGLVRWDRAGGWLVGIGTLAAVAISLEGLPFVVLAYACLVVAMFLRVDGAAVMLRRACAIMFWLSVPLAYGLLGPVGLLSTQCDAFSAPYIVLLTGFSAILWCVARFVPNAGWAAQAAALAVPGVALLVVFAVLFPQCLAGPYWMIDPLSKSHWLDRVAQEHSALYFIQQGQASIILLAVILASVLTLASSKTASRRGDGWVGLLIVLIIAWAALMLTLILNRYIRFAFAFAPLFVPVAAQFLLDGSTGRTARRVALGCVAIYVAVAGLIVVATPVPPPMFDAADYMGYDTCEQGDFSALAANAPGRIAAPQGMGATLISALPPGFSVAAIPFHRAAPGMKRMFEAFLSSDRDVRRNALAPFDYVAICRFPLKTDYGTAPLYDALSIGKDWPGLIRLPTGANNPFQLFRIDHSALQ
ncbi:hypothetical protein J2T09_001611 [Neorhizobium huautlense]|uniref:4-amino-4-deoxy-L-arabinose transferase-like glycosyltransferase n=1 Tax=Neorhizobium huautlense TaxID=67774 RepID=A0ABT9PQX5_9HYPH|nr:hypothetical protein [Neorhizobium huautlense]MDP9836866.1 hypothetical protein [Neorhizobium huautlense]